MQIVYDPAKISYEKLLEVFWHNIDPLSGERPVLRPRAPSTAPPSSIRTRPRRPRPWPRRSKLEESGRFKKPIVTRDRGRAAFYPAEEYHQDFYKKNPVRYQTYRMGCGRDQRLKELWGDAAGGHK